jgi:hypothetical protein
MKQSCLDEKIKIIISPTVERPWGFKQLELQFKLISVNKSINAKKAYQSN